MDLDAAEEVSSGPPDLQALAQAQNENFERLARTLQSGMESLASGLATKFTGIFKVIEEQSLGRDKPSNHDRGNDSVEVEGLPGGKGPINPRKTRKRRFEYADEGSDSSDPGGDRVPCKKNRKEALTSQTRDTNNDPTGTRVEAIMRMLVQNPVLIPASANMLKLPFDRKRIHPLYPKLDLLAVHVSGIPYKAMNFEKTLRKSSLIPGDQEHKNVTNQYGENGGGYSTICAARSALATCIAVDNVPNLAEHVLVKRFVKGVFNRHPPTPKYTSIWDINIVLDFLKKLPDNADLSFEQLSKKFVVLLLILSARRKHTLTCIHIDKIKISREQLTIMPMGNLKHSRPNWKEEPIILNRFMENPKPCVVSCAECYIEERKKLSVVADKLIVTHKKP
eukprot:gene14823-16363_t